METIDVSSSGGVAIVRLNRPPVNAVSKQMMRELREAFDAISQDRGVGAAVLTAAGDRAFCGGIDLKETPNVAAWYERCTARPAFAKVGRPSSQTVVLPCRPSTAFSRFLRHT